MSSTTRLGVVVPMAIKPLDKNSTVPPEAGPFEEMAWFDVVRNPCRLLRYSFDKILREIRKS
jgi:hypothetical protein